MHVKGLFLKLSSGYSCSGQGQGQGAWLRPRKWRSLSLLDYLSLGAKSFFSTGLLRPLAFSSLEAELSSQVGPTQRQGAAESLNPRPMVLAPSVLGSRQESSHRDWRNPKI